MFFGKMKFSTAALVLVLSTLLALGRCTFLVDVESNNGQPGLRLGMDWSKDIQRLSNVRRAAESGNDKQLVNSLVRLRPTLVRVRVKPEEKVVLAATA